MKGDQCKPRIFIVSASGFRSILLVLTSSGDNIDEKCEWLLMRMESTRFEDFYELISNQFNLREIVMASGNIVYKYAV